MSSVKPTRPEPGLKALLRRWRRRRRQRAAPVVAGSTRPSVATTDSPRADPAPGVHGVGEASAPTSGPDQFAPQAGAYLTTGGALLRVEHVHTDSDTGTTFVELEDCSTMELSICTADTLAAQNLRSVVPMPAGERHPVPDVRRENIRDRAGWAAAPR
jgi:hypothetical protein